MSDTEQKLKLRAILSADLTVPNTAEILAFYQQVIGWQVEGLTMSDEQGDYEDYVVKDQDGNWVGGICHARGANKDLPPQWLIYIPVPDIAASLQSVTALGGKILHQSVAEDGSINYAVIQDPAGAVMSLLKGA